MKDFYKKVLCFALPTIILLILLECFFRSFTNTQKYKYNYATDHSKDIEILFLGQSHSGNGIDCYMFNHSAFSLAMGGQGYPIDYHLLETFIPQMPNLQVVGVPLSYHSLLKGDMFGMQDGLLYANLYYHYKINPFSLDNYEIFHMSSCKLKLESLLKGEKLIICDSLGCFLHHNEIYEVNEANYKHEIDQLSSDNLEQNDTIVDNIRLLDQMANICKEHSITFVLFTVPLHDCIRYDKDLNQKQLELNNEVVAQLQAKYDNIIYVDEFYSTKYLQSDFYNSTHLNRSGATKMTQAIIDSLKEKTGIDY